MNHLTFLKTGVVWGASLLMTGCATVPREAGFPAVKENVSERTGLKVHWNQGGPDDEKIASEIRSLLSKELSAESAVQIALLNNRNLQATYESLTIAQADLVAAGLLKNPIFDAEVRFHPDGGTSMELAVVQDFVDILYIPMRKRLAEAVFEREKLRVAGAVLDLAGETRKAFYSLQAAYQTLELRRHILTATESSYDLSTRLRAAGNVTELDVANERALYEETKLSVRASELAVLKGRERLNVLMGLWGNDTKWQIASRLSELPASEISQEGLERRAVERSLDLGVSKYEVERTAKALGIAKPFGLFSDTEVGVSAERETDGEWGVGPAVSLPLPLFNQGQTGVASAEGELRRAWESYAAKAIALRSQVRSSHAALIAARDEATYYAKVVLPLREKIVNETQLQYNAMQVGAFQLLDAKRQQIEAATSYIRSLNNYWLSRTELDQLLAGRMNASQREDAGEDSQGSSAGSANRGGH